MGKNPLIIADVDGTAYPADAIGEAYLTEGRQNEDRAIASRLGLSVEDVARTFAAHEDNKTRSAVVTGIFQLPSEWWNEIRLSCYIPEKYFSPDPELVSVISSLAAHHDLVFATNNPREVGVRVLKALGFRKLIDSGVIPVVGPTEVGLSKPNPAYFTNVASMFRYDPSDCMSIGDRREVDYIPAIEAGMKAILVETRADLFEALQYAQQASQFNFEEAVTDKVSSVLISGDIHVFGLTGQAGAGKTTSAQRVIEIADDMGCPAVTLPLDWYFKLSSKARKAWLAQADDAVEAARRRNQILWWDTERLANDLVRIRNREVLHLRGIYNRRDGGELTGNETVRVPSSGGALIIV